MKEHTVVSVVIQLAQRFAKDIIHALPLAVHTILYGTNFHF